MSSSHITHIRRYRFLVQYFSFFLLRFLLHHHSAFCVFNCRVFFHFSSDKVLLHFFFVLLYVVVYTHNVVDNTKLACFILDTNPVRSTIWCDGRTICWARQMKRKKNEKKGTRIGYFIINRLIYKCMRYVSSTLHMYRCIEYRQIAKKIECSLIYFMHVVANIACHVELLVASE